MIGKDETEIDVEAASLDTEFSPQQNLVLKQDHAADNSTPNRRQTNIELENSESLNAADAETDELQSADR